ncbi:MAG: TonB-dependent receptor [Verrucomicrobia bacterium]|nr:TonB-dependent receptor [Verrucomicrobiota bacterium]
MARTPKTHKDRTGLVISLVFHVALVAGVLYWAAHTETGKELLKRYLEFVRSQREQRQELSEPRRSDRPPPPPPPPPSSQLPKSLAPPVRSGTRRAVAADAPAAVGETFFVDTRAQTQGSSKTGPGAAPDAKRIEAPPPRKALPSPVPNLSIFKAPASTISALLQERSQAAASVEAVSSEQISKSGVSDAADIISKVSGATVSDEGHAVIRGLTDRYSAATLNGAELPSSDPYRRSASLDMFPAKIIDRVAVTKTFTPDQPGSFTGGNINIVTKSFPDRPFFSLELGGSYNTQSSLNDEFLSYPGGATDWLAMDDGTRELPSALSPQNLKLPNVRSRVSYIGTTPSASAQQQFAGNDNADALVKALGPAPFGPTPQTSPLNHSFSLAGGNTSHLFGRPIGVFFSLPYSHDYSFYDDGKVGRYQYDRSKPGALEQVKGYTEVRGKEAINWSGTVNLAYQFSQDHELGFNFLFNQFAEDSARVRRGWDRMAGDQIGSTSQEQDRLQWIERNLTMYQLKGGHLFPSLKDLKFDWLATLTDTTQDEPDVRFFSSRDGRFGDANLDPQYPARFFRNLEENNVNLKFDFALPFSPLSWKAGALKFGLFDSTSERQYNERLFFYGADDEFLGVGPNAFATPTSLGYLRPPATNITSRSTTVRYQWPTYLRDSFDNTYQGDRTISAGYLMADLPVGERLRLIGGARYEKTEIEVVSRSTLPDASSPDGRAITSTLDKAHLLPALSLVYGLTTNMNLRFSYGATLARPSFRELAPIRSYDPVLDVFLVGNNKLRMTEIQNYDVRWEFFPNPGELLSLGVFYKDLTDIIEKRYVTVVGDIVTFDNRDEAKVYGIELEARKNLGFIDPRLSRFSIGGNFSLIESEVDIPEEEQVILRGYGVNKTTRPLSDQSPYILNFDLSYDNPRSGTSASLLLNLYGPRLVITSLNSPDLYEQTAPALDFIFSQRIGRNLRLKFSAKNLLNPAYQLTYGKNSKDIYTSYRKGTSFGLSMTYDF